jgi:hypothetical protein
MMRTGEEIRCILHGDSANQKSHVTKERLYYEERKSIRNQVRGDRTVENHMKQKSDGEKQKQSQAPPSVP